LGPTSETEALRKVSLLFSCGEPPTRDDLAHIPRYEQLKRLAENYRNNPAGALFILQHYANEKDPVAVETLLHLLIDEQRIDEAETLVAEIRGSAAATSDIVQSLILRVEKRNTEEKELLRRALLPEISRGEPYPALRLMEMAGADNQRARVFLQNLLAALGVPGYRPAEQEWQRLSALREELILAQANFRPLDGKLRSLAQLLAQARVAERKEERRFEPLSSSTHRDILTLLEKLSLALRIDPPSAFFDPSLIGPLTIGLANLPVLVFGKGATVVDRKRLAFLIATNLFLIGSGVFDGHQEKGVTALTARLGEILAMPDKARAPFVRTLKKKQQPDVTAALAELDGTSEQDIAGFGERLYLASLLYAFSVIPDIGVVFALNGESKGNLDAPSSRSAQMFDFALNAFLG
ncbi:MAG TPA: QueT transporter family protein, partial [bacterium]|nr:QueT transporter family protein [bacterium]